MSPCGMPEGKEIFLKFNNQFKIRQEPFNLSKFCLINNVKSDPHISKALLRNGICYIETEQLNGAIERGLTPFVFWHCKNKTK